MGRRVITLGREAFSEACCRLESLVAGAGFAPDAVMSIAHGGVYVGEQLFKNIPHFSTSLQRPSTRYKRPRLKAILRLVPQPVLDMLRKVEAMLLALRKPQPVDIAQIVIPEQIVTCKRILVVDDAVDSGATLDGVLRALCVVAPEADVRTAVVTVTTTHPLAVPDFAVYDDLTLIRFPWSMDVKGKE